MKNFLKPFTTAVEKKLDKIFHSLHHRTLVTEGLVLCLKQHEISVYGNRIDVHCLLPNLECPLLYGRWIVELDHPVVRIRRFAFLFKLCKKSIWHFATNSKVLLLLHSFSWNWNKTILLHLTPSPKRIMPSSTKINKLFHPGCKAESDPYTFQKCYMTAQIL